MTEHVIQPLMDNVDSSGDHTFTAMAAAGMAYLDLTCVRLTIYCPNLVYSRAIFNTICLAEPQCTQTDFKSQRFVLLIANLALLKPKFAIHGIRRRADQGR